MVPLVTQVTVMIATCTYTISNVWNSICVYFDMHQTADIPDDIGSITYSTQLVLGYLSLQWGCVLIRNILPVNINLHVPSIQMTIHVCSLNSDKKSTGSYTRNINSCNWWTKKQTCIHCFKIVHV